LNAGNPTKVRLLGKEEEEKKKLEQKNAGNAREGGHLPHFSQQPS
jgi:hypothetical protein